MPRFSLASFWDSFSGARDRVFEPETEALVARFTTPPTALRKNQINALIKDFKNSGQAWSKTDVLGIAAAADSQAATRNWKQNLYNATPINSPDFVADRGFKSNGTSSYLQTGFIASSAGGNYVQDSATLGVFMLDDLSGAQTYDIAAFRSGGDARINARNGTSTETYLNDTSGTQATVASSIGLTMISRTDSANVKIYKNGTLLHTSARASIQVPNSQFGVLAFGAGNNYSLRRCAAWIIGGGYTDAEALGVYNAINKYLTAVGAV